MKKARVEIRRSGSWQWTKRNKNFVKTYYWRFVGANDKIMCHSEEYASRSNALRAARRFLELAKNAEIVND